MGTKIYLFVGVESFDWQPADFQPVIEYAQAHHIDGLLIKVFDGMQGEWYNGQFPAIFQRITGSGLDCVPFGFHYGNARGSSLTGEAALGVKYMHTYGKYCANMEADWDGQGDWGGQIASIIAEARQQKAGVWWVSTWANITEHSWRTITGHLAPVVDAFMPEAYNDSLDTLMNAEYVGSGLSQSQIQPTFELSLTEFGANHPVQLAAAYQKNNPANVSLWEWQWAKADPGTVDAVVAAIKGSPAQGGNMPLVLSPSGCVLDLVKSYQLDGGSEDKCGPWSVSELHYAGLPGHGPTGTPTQVQAWAHAEYTKYIGPDVLSDQNGSSIDNMHQFLKDAGLHWWDITTIAPGSKQSDDIARLHRALDAGYPVLVTVNEQSVKRRNGSNPYPWQPRLGPVNHIFTIVGHTSDGYLLVDDELNQSDSWPDQYSEASIECHWASVVQVVGPDAAKPWLKSIPGGDPLQWPAGFNAQNFGGNTMGVPQGWHDDGTVLTAPNGHKVVLGFRKFILDGPWNPADVPQEEEHGQNPLEAYYAQPTNSGSQQVFLYTVLNYNAVRGVYKMGVGNEFLGLRRDLEKAQSRPPVDPQIADLQALLATALAKAGQLEATITKVKADLAA